MNFGLLKYILVLPFIQFSGNLSVEQFDKDFGTLTIPLKRAGNLLLIEATVDGVTGNFVFDTGATKPVLNLTYFRENLQKAYTTAGGASGSTSEVFYTHIDSLKMGTLLFTDLKPDVVNLGHIENRRGVRILGLLGLSLFESMEMEIDVKNQLLILHQLDKKGERVIEPETATDYNLTWPIRIHSGTLFLKGEVGGRSLDFCLDTGAESNVIHSTSSRKVMETISIARRSNLTGSGSRQVEVLYGTMTQFNLGEYAFPPMQTIITSLDALSLAYDFPLDGILGYDFFAKGVFSINLVKKEMQIKTEGGMWP